MKTFKNKTLQHESILHKALKSYRIPEASEWYQNHPEVIVIMNKTLSSKNTNILTVEQTMAHTEISLPQKTPLSFSKTDNYPSLMFKLGDRLSSLTRVQTYTLVGAIGLYLSGVSEDIEESKKVFNSPDPSSTDPYDADNLSFPERVTKCLDIIERENPEGLTDILLAISDYWEQYILQTSNQWRHTLLA